MQNTIVDDEVVNGLRAAPRSAWLRYLDAVDVLALTNDYGRWRGGIAVEGGDGVLDMPWIEYSEEVDRVLQALHAVNALVDVDLFEVDVTRQLVTSRSVAIGDVARLISTIVRMERYSQGQLLRSLEDGTFPSLFRRLAAWYRAQR